MLTMRVASKAAKSTAKPGTAEDDAGESTEESETIEQYQERLAKWVSVCLRRAGEAGEVRGRDEYKKSGIVYDKRKSVISQFLKSLTKKRCEKCGA